ncbi:MAG: TatD family hydrolase [Candidatus Saccharibacteria bacterium]
MLVDTHCHIHEASYQLNADEVVNRARENGVTEIICVGDNEQSSIEALEFAAKHDGIYATIGIHPHYAEGGLGGLAKLIDDNHDNIVAIGEIGLDYHHNHSPRADQINLLRDQIKLALQYDLPIIFHVREAFDDFWPIFDEFTGIRGVLHSFTDTVENLQAGLDRGLYIGVNGYSTFTKDEAQKAMFASIPVVKMILETDAPFLTPVPFRGKINESAYIKNIAEYHGVARGIGFDEISSVTTANARELFNLKT